jgi:hypothetical protein
MSAWSQISIYQGLMRRRLFSYFTMICLTNSFSLATWAQSSSGTLGSRVEQFSRLLEQHSTMKNISQRAKLITTTQTSYQCWRVIHRTHLRPLGLVDDRLSAGKFYAAVGRDVDRELEGQDFVNLMKQGQIYQNVQNICSLPAGVVLVYNSAIPNFEYGDFGHVETKTGSIGFGNVSSDFKNVRPVTGGCATKGRHFTLKAIMIPREVYLDIAAMLK